VPLAKGAHPLEGDAGSISNLQQQQQKQQQHTTPVQQVAVSLALTACLLQPVSSGCYMLLLLLDVAPAAATDLQQQCWHC
jgi:hypothetical protein